MYLLMLTCESVVLVSSKHRLQIVQGTGPWNLDVRVVGPKSSESILIPGIENSRTTLQIPVPKRVDEEGGSFEIDLGR